MRRFLSVLLCLLALASLCSPAYADGTGVADASQMAAVTEVLEPGMSPVYAEELLDGEYPVSFKCSSSMFRIDSVMLTVKDGALEAALTMGSGSFLYVYPGTAEEAANAPEDTWIAPTEENGAQIFTIPVEALDAPVPCAAFSRNKELWYDRTLLFRADSLPASAFRTLATAESLSLADGEYLVGVTLGGGSGRAGIQSPCRLWIENDEARAEIVWGSKNYDYMKVDGARFDAEIRDGHSVCVIPIAAFDRPLAVIADTVAMSTPHEIDYTLYFDSASITPARTTLRYADQFSLEYGEENDVMLTIGEDRYLLVPAGSDAKPDPGVTLIRTPVKTLYAASSSAMDPIIRIGALPSVRFTSTKREDWTLPEVREGMKEGSLLYAGKYAAPDYELLLGEGTELALENTMIYHTPETKEQLEALGIPVLTERSSYEAHPLGRLEWVKLYGLLTGKTAEAERFFDEQAALAEHVFDQAPTGKTAAFFYIAPNGGVNVRRAQDYVARMIELAGGQYVPADDGDEADARSTMSMETESFYAAAKDADVLFYSATVGGNLDTMDELLAKAAWLADFKAVKDGNVWCAEKDLFQQSSGVAVLIDEFYRIFSGAAETDALTYFHKLS